MEFHNCLQATLEHKDRQQAVACQALLAIHMEKGKNKTKTESRAKAENG